jgi:triosephosphate isomerase
MSGRRPLIAGNAKMHLDRESLTRLLDAVGRDLERNPPRCEVAYCPPFPLLAAAAGSTAGSTIALGGQNMHWESAGAFTGEVSARMLAEAGCRYVILGHSERRTLFGETDAAVARKTAAAQAAGLVPIVCVGESESDRDGGGTEAVLTAQVRGSLAGIAPARGEIVVAYEPVWAIGTGRNATPDQAQAAHAHLREELARILGPEAAAGIRILYGGSVKPENAGSLLRCRDIDGALVGGASLEPHSFLGIVRAAG